MKRVYLDACTIIYLIEASAPFHTGAVERVRALLSDPADALVTSRLSLLECRVRPLRENNGPLLDAYERFFSARRVLVCEITPAVIERATLLRARHNFRTPDAIHMATAVEIHADSFVTGDAALESCPDVRVFVLRSAS